MLVTASIASDFATGVAVLAGLIAVGGFLAHAGPVLGGDTEAAVRQATVKGGLAGLGVGVVVVVLSAIASNL